MNFMFMFELKLGIAIFEVFRQLLTFVGNIMLQGGHEENFFPARPLLVIILSLPSAVEDRRRGVQHPMWKTRLSDCSFFIFK